MGIKGGIGEFISAVFSKAKAIDGKIIGEDNDIIKSKLASTDKGAWVDHLVDQHLKHETIDTPPPEFEITMKDIVEEISKREINKIFGK